MTGDESQTFIAVTDMSNDQDPDRESATEGSDWSRAFPLIAIAIVVLGFCIAAAQTSSRNSATNFVAGAFIIVGPALIVATAVLATPRRIRGTLFSTFALMMGATGLVIQLCAWGKTTDIPASLALVSGILAGAGVIGLAIASHKDRH